MKSAVIEANKCVGPAVAGDIRENMVLWGSVVPPSPAFEALNSGYNRNTYLPNDSAARCSPSKRY